MIDEVLQGNLFSNRLVGASLNLRVFVFVGKNFLQWGTKLSCCAFTINQSSHFDNTGVIYILLKNVFQYKNN